MTYCLAHDRDVPDGCLCPVCVVESAKRKLKARLRLEGYVANWTVISKLAALGSHIVTTGEKTEAEFRRMMNWRLN